MEPRLKVTTQCYKQTFNSRTLLTTLQYLSASEPSSLRPLRRMDTNFGSMTSQLQNARLFENREFDLLHQYLTPHWGWLHRNFIKIFGTRKLYSLGYHAVLIARWSIQSL